MDRHQQCRKKGKDDAMQHIETEQCLMAYLIGSQHKKADIFSYKGRKGHDRRPHRNTPVS
jgi:hypothetical protein